MVNKNFIVAIGIASVFVFYVSRIEYNDDAPSNKSFHNENSILTPYEWMTAQRAYPDKEFDLSAYISSMAQTKNQSIANKLSSTTFSGSWTTEGPTNIGGRINAIAVHPSNSNIIYIGCATGGVFKTVNGGLSWAPIFDNQPFLSIGCISIDPINPNTIYVGTGDPNISGYPFIGDGIYKSIDGGLTWSNKGLSAQRIISKIIVDPNNTSILYAATMGLPFTRNNDRGLYKSTDGGNTWNQILFVSNEAGIIDLVMNPSNTQILYAASWNRIRSSFENIGFGNESRIWKSTDGGTSWNVLSNGLPNQKLSRIGLCISASNPNILYTSIVDTTYDLLGVFKTTDHGQSWSSVPLTNLSIPDLTRGFGWYFGKIAINPSNNNEIYIAGVEAWKTDPSGSYWYQATPNWYSYIVHADMHAFEFINGSTMLLGTDGGTYKTQDNCVSWTDIDEIPNTQFYRVAYNPHSPLNYYGGAQDNGSTGGNASFINYWPRIWGGDGFQMAFDPNDPNVFYTETQNGGLFSTADGGNNYQNCDMGIDTSDRRSWDMPYVMSGFNSYNLYTGTYRVYKNTNGPYANWSPISDDLTDGVVTDEPRFHVISAIDLSTINSNFIYVGTSDGNVWRSLNDGASWDSLHMTLPNRYVTSIKASPNVANTVYVTHSGYKSNEFIPHIHKSIDNGSTWTDISGNLPQMAINDVYIYSGNENILFVATDAGVYYTTNAGNTWSRLGNNMPLIPVYDIDYNPSTGRLVAGTFSRSIMTFGVDSLFSGIKNSSATFNNTIILFPNPSKENVSINFNNNETELTHYFIYNSTGELVIDNNCLILNGVTNLSIEKLPMGNYFITIQSKEKTYRKKLIKV